MSEETSAPERRTCNVEEAGRLLGISRNSAYNAAGTGEIPTIRIGNRILVSLAWLNKVLGAA